MAPKKKSEKMALGDFLTNQSLGSWADEMDSQPILAVPSYGSSGAGGGERRAFSTQSTWGADRAQRGGMDDRGASYDRPRFSDREQLPLPTRPPFTAHLGNLAFDVTQSDIESFLNGCEVTSIRIVEDKMDQKPKGFGYVEFASVDGLKKALTLTDTQFMGRPIRVSVAEPPKDRGESTRDFSDWSRKGPLPELPAQGRQMSRGFSQRGGFDNMSDAGSERGGSRRAGFFQDDGKVRDLGNWERKGPLSPAPNQGPPVRDGGRLRDAPQGERRESPAWGEGRTDSGSRPPRERPQVDRAPTAAEQDTQWRARMKPDASPAATPDVSTPSSPQPQAPKERPRLNLAKRTVSTVDQATTPADDKASPFGAARPIDTSAREREIDEKRQIAIRQKKEADDKAREEKASAKAKAAAEDKTSSPAEEKPRKSSKANGAKGPAATKENGETQRPSFSILQREAEGGGADEEDAAGERDLPDASANGNIIGDKETKPQEIVQEASKGDAETTDDALDGDGWSTVQSGKKSRGTAARALAS